MSEKKPGVIERSSEKIRWAAGWLGVLALAGSVIAPVLAGLAAESGAVWLGSDYVNSTSKGRRLNARG